MNNVWEHLSGDKTAGVKSNFSKNIIGGYRGHTMVMSSDSIYVYGGVDDDEGIFGVYLMVVRYNDLWRFSIQDYKWVHVTGNKTGFMQADFDVPYPAGLTGHTMDMDSHGNFYIFAGHGHYSTNAAGIININTYLF